MNTVNVEIKGIVPLEFECLEGHMPTPAQIEWITELYMEKFLKTPVEERIKSAISEESEIAWLAHDVLEAELPEFIEQLIMQDEIEMYLDSEEFSNSEETDTEGESKEE